MIEALKAKRALISTAFGHIKTISSPLRRFLGIDMIDRIPEDADETGDATHPPHYVEERGEEQVNKLLLRAQSNYLQRYVADDVQCIERGIKHRRTRHVKFS